MQLCVVLLGLLAGLVASQSDAMFYNPPQPGPDNDYSQNAVYQVGSTVQVRWSASWDRISLTLWQHGNNDFEYLLPAAPNPNNYNWVVNTNKNYSSQSDVNGTVFFLIAFYPGNTSGNRCHYFNITNANSVNLPSTTSALPAAATTTVAMTMTTLMTVETTTLRGETTTVMVTLTANTSSSISSSPSPTGAVSGGLIQPATALSSASKAGIGVGIGVGVPALVGLGIFAGWMLRASNKRRDPSITSHRARHSWIPLDKYHPPYTTWKLQEAPSRIEELAGPEPAYELPPVASRRGSME